MLPELRAFFNVINDRLLFLVFVKVSANISIFRVLCKLRSTCISSCYDQSGYTLTGLVNVYLYPNRLLVFQQSKYLADPRPQRRPYRRLNMNPIKGRRGRPKLPNPPEVRRQPPLAAGLCGTGRGLDGIGRVWTGLGGVWTGPGGLWTNWAESGRDWAGSGQIGRSLDGTGRD